MDARGGEEPPRIGSRLDPVRAAIAMVADGSARRVTIRTALSREILPAARRIARMAGVRVELADTAGARADLVVMPAGMGRR
ncbi:MAG: hypothetical protein H0U86_18235 [Chloroflexi bacterium]|nr:hypothetical protein [Chloroflexota bacterium]